MDIPGSVSVSVLYMLTSYVLFTTVSRVRKFSLFSNKWTDPPDCFKFEFYTWLENASKTLGFHSANNTILNFFKKSHSRSSVRTKRCGEWNSEVLSLNSLIRMSAVFAYVVYMQRICGFSVLQELLSARRLPKEILLLVVTGPNICNVVVGV